MFLFNEGPGTRQSIEYEFMGLSQGESSISSQIFLYQGAVPATTEDTPFDIDNPIEVIGNSIGHFTANFVRNSSLNELQFSGLHRLEGLEFKQHYYDAVRSKWRLYPKFVVNDSSWTELSAGNYTDTDISYAYRYGVSTSTVCNIDTDLFTSGNSSIGQTYISRNRYPYQDPLIWEFDQVVTLDHMFLNQTHSGGNYDNTYFDIQYWDPALNTGQGGWSSTTRISYVGGNTLNEITIPELTSNRFRIAGQDTASQGWITKNFVFFSNTEPTVVPFDVTWALLGTQFLGSDNLFTYGQYDTRAVKVDNPRLANRLPWILVSVGDADHEGALFLENATNISGKERILPQSLRLRF